MRPITFTLPFLPPSLNVYRRDHWHKQWGEQKVWKDLIALKWSELGRPKLKDVRIGMVFSFPDRRVRDLDNYLATGSKLVGDAVKGRFIPDDSPEHLAAWSFRFEFGKEAKTTVVIEEVDMAGEGEVAGKEATLGEEMPAAATAIDGHDATGRLAGRQPTAEAATAPSDDPRAACRLHASCSSPLCPRDQISLKEGIWYPDEEICRSRHYGNLPWIRAQRKIARVAASGYFTVEMLTRLVVIRKGIVGLDPNLPEEPQLRAWLQKRAEKQDGATEAKAERTRHLKKYRFQKQVAREG